VGVSASVSFEELVDLINPDKIDIVLSWQLPHKIALAGKH